MKNNVSKRKGIVLAGGHGTRLNPITVCLSKQLLPVYDKPMVYYAVSYLMHAGINSIMIISTPRHIHLYQTLLSDGSKWGVEFTYATQDQPKGIADAFRIGKKFIGTSPVALALGDNIFFGGNFLDTLNTASSRSAGATILLKEVNNPNQYGVAKYACDGHLEKIIEKPTSFISQDAVTGLYFFDNSVCDRAAELKLSARGELEITDINQLYIDSGELNAEKLDKQCFWFDSGSPSGLLDASSNVHEFQTKNRTIVGSPELVAYQKGWITRQDLVTYCENLFASEYSEKLQKIVKSL